MRLSHTLGKTVVSKDSKNGSFLLTNRNGSYCYFSATPESRYQGVFFKDDSRIFRVIENISIGEEKIHAVDNRLWAVERIRDKGVKETFVMPNNLNAFLYELTKKQEITLTLDIRESYNTEEFGRDYEITQEKGFMIVSFPKDGVYLVVKTDSKVEVISKWVERNYKLDEKRKSPPFNWWVYDALKFNGKKLVCAFGSDKEIAVSVAEKVYAESSSIKDQEKKFFSKYNDAKTKKAIKRFGKEAGIAYACARASLEGLATTDPGIYAGLPWFFQYWARDEALSLKPFINIKNSDIAKTILLEHLERMGSNGRLQNHRNEQGNSADSMVSADAAGIVYMRLAELIKQNRLDNNETEKVKTVLEKTIKNLLMHRTEGFFDFNGQKETWMDTIARDGVRIEIQALRLLMYKLVFKLTKEKQYKYLEEKLAKAVKQRFLHGKILYDGIGDITARPNVFLAAYIYPEMFTKNQWKNVFNHSLNHLWLDWGGLSTIDTESREFTGKDSGQEIKAYHNGDSWYWINNLAGVVLSSIDKRGFNSKTKEILEASTNDILWQGAMGHHSEVSSALKQEAAGCVAQAWSNAFFIELVDNLI